MDFIMEFVQKLIRLSTHHPLLAGQVSSFKSKEIRQNTVFNVSTSCLLQKLDSILKKQVTSRPFVKTYRDDKRQITYVTLQYQYQQTQAYESVTK